MFRSRRKWLALTAALVSVALACGGWRIYEHHRYKHLAVHEQGMIYRSAWLAPEVLAELIEEYQLRTVVNLCRPDEMTPADWAAQRKAVEGAGARLVEIPMPVSVSLKDRELAMHLEIMQDPDNYPMLVHCQHGVTRTAKYLAMYDIAFRGKTACDSLAAQPKFGRDEHNVHVRAFARTFERYHRELYESAEPEKLSVLRD